MHIRHDVEDSRYELLTRSGTFSISRSCATVGMAAGTRSQLLTDSDINVVFAQCCLRAGETVVAPVRRSLGAHPIEPNQQRMATVDHRPIVGQRSVLANSAATGRTRPASSTR